MQYSRGQDGTIDRKLLNLWFDENRSAFKIQWANKNVDDDNYGAIQAEDGHDNK